MRIAHDQLPCDMRFTAWNDPGRRLFNFITCKWMLFRLILYIYLDVFNTRSSLESNGKEL